MIDIAQHSGVQILGDLVLPAESLDRGIIEFRRTVKVILQRRGRKSGMPYGLYIGLSLNYLLRREISGGVRLDKTAFYRHSEMILKLFDVTAFLPVLHAFGPGIINQRHLLRPLDETVEIVRPDSVLKLVSRQTEALAELRRDE